MRTNVIFTLSVLVLCGTYYFGKCTIYLPKFSFLFHFFIKFTIFFTFVHCTNRWCNQVNCIEENLTMLRRVITIQCEKYPLWIHIMWKIVNGISDTETGMDGIFPMDLLSMTFSKQLHTIPFTFFHIHVESIVNRLHRMRKTPKSSCIHSLHFELPNDALKFQIHFGSLHLVHLIFKLFVHTNPVLVLNLIQLFVHKSVIILESYRNLMLWSENPTPNSKSVCLKNREMKLV